MNSLNDFDEPDESYWEGFKKVISIFAITILLFSVWFLFFDDGAPSRSNGVYLGGYDESGNQTTGSPEGYLFK